MSKSNDQVSLWLAAFIGPTDYAEKLVCTIFQQAIIVPSRIISEYWHSRRTIQKMQAYVVQSLNFAHRTRRTQKRESKWRVVQVIAICCFEKLAFLDKLSDL